MPDFNTQVSEDDPETIIQLLKTYVDSSKDWETGVDGQPLEGNQLVAIWLENKDEIKKREFLKLQENKMNLKLSEHNNVKYLYAEKKDYVGEWDFIVLKELESGDPNWLEIQNALGHDEEDALQVEYMKKAFLENSKELIQDVREVLQENLEQEATSFIFNKQAQESVVGIEDLKNQLIGDEDLSRTEHGPIDESAKLENNFDSSIVGQAVSEANRFVNVSDKEILTMDSGDSGPYGVVETELQRKIIKRRLLDEIDKLSNPDGTISEQAAQEIINSKWEVEKGNQAIAFRVNPQKIKGTIEELMPAVEQGAAEAGLEDRIDEMRELTLTLAIGSVIAHEGEHATHMSAEEGDPRGESGAEEMENKFIDTMLQDPKYELIQPFIERKGADQTAEMQTEPIDAIQHSSSKNSWYKAEDIL